MMIIIIERGGEMRHVCRETSLLKTTFTNASSKELRKFQCRGLFIWQQGRG